MRTERDNEMNTIWSELTMPVQNAIMKANMAAKELVQLRDRQSWLEIGEGLHDIRVEALHRADTENVKHPQYRYYQGLLLAKVPDLLALNEHDHAGCQHAVWMYENWQEVESFLADLKMENLRLNHPSSIRRRYDAATKIKPLGLEKPPTKTMRQSARIQELQGEVRDLRAGLHDAEPAEPAEPAERVPVSARYQIVTGKFRVIRGAPIEVNEAPQYNPLPQHVIEELADALQVTEENLDQIVKLAIETFVHRITDNEDTAREWVRSVGLTVASEFDTALHHACMWVESEAWEDEEESKLPHAKNDLFRLRRAGSRRVSALTLTQRASGKLA